MKSPTLYIGSEGHDLILPCFDRQAYVMHTPAYNIRRHIQEKGGVDSSRNILMFKKSVRHTQ